MPDLDRFTALLQAHHPLIFISTHEEDDALAVVREAALEQGLRILLWSINGGIRDGLVADSATTPDTDHPAAALCHFCIHPQRVIVVMLDLTPHFKDDRVLRLTRDLVTTLSRFGGHLVLIDSATELPAPLAAIATDFPLSLPDEADLERIVRSTLREQNERRPVQAVMDKKTLTSILRNLRGLTRRQARQIILDAICDDQRFDASDLQRVVAGKRRVLQGAGLLEFVEAPVDLSEVGGLTALKRWLDQRQCAMSDEAVQFGLIPPRGVLLLGVQGAGKSLAAKAVATAWRYPLMRMDVGALYDRYIGESERRLKETLRQAEQMSPIVLWIDEIEKGFASAASRSVDGGLSQRMFGALLTWMQEHRASVFLVATANDIEALPPELLRKGRFDEIFFVDLPNLEARQMIFTIHLRKRKQDVARFDTAALAEAAEGFSGAEIEQAIIAAMHSAFAARGDLTTAHIIEAIRGSPPLSVTMKERLDGLRAWSHGRCVPAD